MVLQITICLSIVHQAYRASWAHLKRHWERYAILALMSDWPGIARWTRLSMVPHLASSTDLLCSHLYLPGMVVPQNMYVWLAMLNHELSFESCT